MRIKVDTTTLAVSLSIAAIVVATVLTACKKQSATQRPRPFIEHARTWFLNTVVEPEKTLLKGSKRALLKHGYFKDFLRMGKLNDMALWTEAKEFQENGVHFLIVPIDQILHPFKNPNHEAARTLVFYEIGRGEMRMEVVEILSSKGESLGRSPMEITYGGFLNWYTNRAATIPGVNATVLFYDEQYRLESSFGVSNGTWGTSTLKLLNKKGPQRARPSTMNSVSTCQGDCQSWYLIGVWYDMATGEVVGYEVLDVWDECVVGFPPPSGYGDSPEPLAGACNMSEANDQANQAINAGEAVTENTTVTTGAETTAPDGEVTREVNIKWDFYRGAMLGYTWICRSFEKGIHKKVNSTTWEWKSLVHNTVTVDGNSPWETTCTVNTATPMIKPDKQTADMVLDYTVTVKVYCFGTLVGTSSRNHIGSYENIRAN